MPAPTRVLAAACAAAVLLLPTGCAASGGGAVTGRTVQVRIAPSPHPVDYEVQVAQAQSRYRLVERMRTGETRAFAVPSGWVTVRIPGLCVVPTRHGASTTTVVEVDGRTCRLV